MADNPLMIPEHHGVLKMTWQRASVINPISVTWGFRRDDDDVQTAAADGYNYAVGAAGPCHSGRMRSEWEFVGCEALMQTAGGAIGGSFGATVQGTLAINNPSIPVGISGILRKKTAFIGKRMRGRCFIPLLRSGIDEINYNGTFVATVSNVYETGWTNWLDLMQGSETIPVLLHTDTNPSGNAPPPTPITTVSVGLQLGNQRRRYD